MQAVAVVFAEPHRLALSQVSLTEPGPADIVVDVAWSGVSTGTERLLWTGRMPAFPGMGYPLVPGYEAVGRVVSAGADAGRREGEFVFVPGARCFGELRGLFGASASRLVVPGDKAITLPEAAGRDGVLLALAATAQHIYGDAAPPELIVGHGVLGRLAARLAVLAGGSPVVWETNPQRQSGGLGYAVMAPDADPRRDYRRICDVSGDAGLLDTLIGRAAPGAEIVLAGFYAERLSFAFPPAFMREVRLRIAAEWQRPDLEKAQALIACGLLSLDGLISHAAPAARATEAYPQAFEDASCLKMVLDWRQA